MQDLENAAGGNAGAFGPVDDVHNLAYYDEHVVAHLPEPVIAKAHHWLILHGRYVCMARKPKCTECGITGICDYYQKKQKKEQ